MKKLTGLKRDGSKLLYQLCYIPGSYAASKSTETAMQEPILWPLRSLLPVYIELSAVPTNFVSEVLGMCC